MTLLITLPPEMEKRLVDEARRQGVDPSEFATQLLQDGLAVSAVRTHQVDDIDQVLDEFFASNPEILPALPSDLSRKDFYSDHD